MKIYIVTGDLKLNVSGTDDVFLIGTDSASCDVTICVDKLDSINLYGLFILDNGRSIKLKTETNHIGEDSKSMVLIKTVGLGASSFDYVGKIKILSKSTNCDAYLQNNNLIMSEDVVIKTSPQLEIENNLVKASHGVSTSTVDKNELEYLMSRGLSDKDAKVLIVKGFINDIISKLSSEDYEQIQKRFSNIF